MPVGGTREKTPPIAKAWGAAGITAPAGGGAQLSAAAAAATQPWLLALHADTRPGPAWRDAVAGFIARPAATTEAGYFRFAFDDAAPEARRLEAMVAWRSRWLGLPYCEQGLLLSRDFYQWLGGYPAISAM